MEDIDARKQAFQRGYEQLCNETGIALSYDSHLASDWYDLRKLSGVLRGYELSEEPFDDLDVASEEGMERTFNAAS